MNRYIQHSVLFLFFAVLFNTTSTLLAQDSLPPNTYSLRATPDDEARVRKAVSKYQLEMMLRQWWNLPTDKEVERRAKGLHARHYPRPLAIGADSFDYAHDTLYRRALDSRVLPEQNVVAMGWHRASTDRQHYTAYNFALLSHIAYYSYELNPFTGGYRNFESIFSFKYSDFVPTAHLDTCAVLLSVSCTSEDAAIFFTSQEAAKRNLTDSLISILKEADADGIELSFEEVPRRHKAEFIEFVKNLTYELREANNKYTIMMTIPVYDEDDVYDLYELRAWVDYFIIGGFNHHITPLGMVRGTIAPLRNAEASWRGTRIVYNNTMDLDSLSRLPMTIESFIVTHDKDYQQVLLDSLNLFLATTPDMHACGTLREAINSILSPPAAGLRNNPIVRRMLARTNVIAEVSQSFPPVDNSVRFFLFYPEPTTYYQSELEQFTHTTSVVPREYLVRDAFNKLVNTEATETQGDSTYDLLHSIQSNIDEIGEDYKASLVMGLPYHGAVWNVREAINGGQPEFEGYAPYSQIRALINLYGGGAEVVVDKPYTGMILRLRDSVGVVREIYFDNSATLEQKIEAVLNTGIAGVSVWAFGYDVGYPDLWKLYEQSFAMPRTFNPETNKFEKIKLEKSNKIAFTIRYHLKRLSRVIFGTFFIVAIFMILGFNVVLLDWKVRDILFYTGAFRIFYLTLFTMLILLIGAYVGLFINGWVTFFVGMLLGLGLTWIATIIIQYQHAKLP